MSEYLEADLLEAVASYLYKGWTDLDFKARDTLIPADKKNQHHYDLWSPSERSHLFHDLFTCNINQTFREPDALLQIKYIRIILKWLDEKGAKIMHGPGFGNDQIYIYNPKQAHSQTQIHQHKCTTFLQTPQGLRASSDVFFSAGVNLLWIEIGFVVWGINLVIPVYTQTASSL